jgi:hypothetical protein
VRVRVLVSALALTLGLGGCHAAPPSTLPVAVTLACNEVAQVLGGMPFDDVSREDGPVADPVTGVERPGCRVHARGSRKRLSVLERTDADRPDVRIRELMPPRGWTDDPRYADQGPDRAAFAYRAGGALCQYNARWNAGRDAAPDAPPPDTYRITIACTTAGP